MEPTWRDPVWSTAAFWLQLKNSSKKETASGQCLLVCSETWLKPEVIYFHCPQKEIISQTGNQASGWIKEGAPMNLQGWALRASLLPALLWQWADPWGVKWPWAQRIRPSESPLLLASEINLHCWFCRSEVRRWVFYSALPEQNIGYVSSAYTNCKSTHRLASTGYNFIKWRIKSISKITWSWNMVSDDVDQMDFPSAVVRRPVLCSSVHLSSLKPVNMVSEAFLNY